MYGIIGGSGLANLPDLEVDNSRSVETPYGNPSGPLVTGHIGSTSLVFLPRHGDKHSIAPHQINYRANLWALRQAGVDQIIAVASVGGIRAEFGPESIVIPDQIVDYTWGRPATFFENGTEVKHVDMTEPYSGPLRSKILLASARVGEPVFDGGVYAATQGPRLETAAEINRLERDGADIVGMTGMPEATLARELDIPYATIAVVVNHAAGRGDSRTQIKFAELEAALARTIGRTLRIVRELVKS